MRGCASTTSCGATHDYGEVHRARARRRTVRNATSSASLSSSVSIDQAKQMAEETTREYAKSFFLASKLMGRGREEIYALYAWCRELDQLVDGEAASGLTTDERARSLDGVAERLRVIFDWDSQAVPTDATYADLALYDATRTVQGFEREPFEDMIRGMRRDLEPNAGAFRTFSEVESYAYQVAGTVALMILPILTIGTHNANDFERRERGVALGIALQMTNIVRDVGEDARDRERVYIAEEDLKLFGGMTRDDVLSMQTPTFDYKCAIELQIQRALMYYAQAREGVVLLPLSSRLVAACIAGLYKRILLTVRENRYDNLNVRAYASKLQKLALLPVLVWGSIVGTNDEDGDMRLDFSDDSESGQAYRVAMCRIFVAIASGDDGDEEIARCADILREIKRGVPGKQPMLSRSRRFVEWYKSSTDFGTYEDERIKIDGGTIFHARR